MDVESFDKLLKNMTPLKIKQKTLIRNANWPHERLLATLRFLAFGQSYEDLKFLTRISLIGLCIIIIETIIKTLKKVMDIVLLHIFIFYRVFLYVCVLLAHTN